MTATRTLQTSGEIVAAVTLDDEIAPESLPKFREIIADAAVAAVDARGLIGARKAATLESRDALAALKVQSVGATEASKAARLSHREIVAAVKASRVAVKGLTGLDRLDALLVNSGARVVAAESRASVTGAALVVAALRDDTARARVAALKVGHAVTGARVTLAASDATISRAVEAMRAQ